MCEVATEQPIALDCAALKTCNKCKATLPLTDFYPSRTIPGGWQQSCKKCSKAASQKSAAKNKAREAVVTPLKQICFICGVEKDASCFAVNASLKSGLQRNCSECSKNKCKENRVKNKEKEKVIPDIKKCSGCKLVKSESVFCRVNHTVDGLDYYCKECQARRRRDEGVKAKHNIAQLKRLSTDIQYNLAEKLRGRLRSAVKKGRKGPKAGSAVRDLGCSIEFLKKHLENKFQPGMTWGNYSKYGWHIDHVTPLSAFDLTNREQLLTACHYTNLQPLWWQENLSKGATF